MILRSVAISLSALAVLAAGQAEAAKPKINDVCQADFHKFCPADQPGRGVVIRCARQHLDQVSSDCKSAVDTANALNAARKAAKAARKTSTAQASANSAAAPAAS